MSADFCFQGIAFFCYLVHTPSHVLWQQKRQLRNLRLRKAPRAFLARQKRSRPRKRRRHIAFVFVCARMSTACLINQSNKLLTPPPATTPLSLVPCLSLLIYESTL